VYLALSPAVLFNCCSHLVQSRAIKTILSPVDSKWMAYTQRQWQHHCSSDCIHSQVLDGGRSVSTEIMEEINLSPVDEAAASDTRGREAFRLDERGQCRRGRRPDVVASPGDVCTAFSLDAWSRWKTTPDTNFRTPTPFSKLWYVALDVGPIQTRTKSSETLYSLYGGEYLCQARSTNLTKTCTNLYTER